MDVCFVALIVTALTVGEAVKPALLATPPRAPLPAIHTKPLNKPTVAVVASNVLSAASSKSSSFALSVPLQRKVKSKDSTGISQNQQQLQGIARNERNYYGVNKSGDNNNNFDARNHSSGITLQSVGKPLSTPISKAKNLGAGNIQGVVGNTFPSLVAAYKDNKTKQRVNGISASISPSRFTGTKYPHLKAVPSKSEYLVITDISQVGRPLDRESRYPGTKTMSDHVGVQKPNHVQRKQIQLMMSTNTTNDALFRDLSANNNLPSNLVGKNRAGHQHEKDFSNNTEQRKFPLEGRHEMDSNAGGLHSFLMEVHNSNTEAQSENQNVQVKGFAHGHRKQTGGLQFQNLKSDQENQINPNKTQSKKELQIAMPNYSLQRNVSGEKNMYNPKGNEQFVTRQSKTKQGQFKSKNRESSDVSIESTQGNAKHFGQDSNGFGTFYLRKKQNSLKQSTLLGKPLFHIPKNTTPVHVFNLIGKRKPNQERFQHLNSHVNINKGNSEFLGGQHKGQQKPDFALEQNGGPFEVKIDQTKAPDQPQEEYIDEYDLGDKPLVTTSNQRFVPVDEFGLPFYGNQTDDYFRREAIEAHNRYRMIHGAPPLKLDLQLSREAEEFAKQLAKLGRARHDMKAKLRKQSEGENVARGCSEWGGLTASGAVHRWYAQVCNYDWSKRRTIQENAKNFMRVVWKGTSHLGIGRAVGTRLGFPCTFIVARYRPGKMSAFSLDSNVNEGTFLPSYCNADADDSLARYSKSPQSSPQNTVKDDRDFNGIQGFQDSAEPQAGVTFEPMNSWERNVGQIGVEQQSAEALLNGIFPRVSQEGSQYDGAKIIVEDEGEKRDKEPYKGNEIRSQRVASKNITTQ